MAGPSPTMGAAGYELDAGGDVVRVLYANGTAAARIGEMATLGGVSKSTVKTDGLVDGSTGRRLSERCPGSYFLVQGE